MKQDQKNSWVKKHILPLIGSETSEQVVENIANKMIRKSAEKPEWHLNPSCLQRLFHPKDKRQDVVRRIDQIFKSSISNS